jgi:hypothetical protein
MDLADSREPGIRLRTGADLERARPMNHRGEDQAPLPQSRSRAPPRAELPFTPFEPVQPCHASDLALQCRI